MFAMHQSTVHCTSTSVNVHLNVWQIESSTTTCWLNAHMYQALCEVIQN